MTSDQLTAFQANSGFSPSAMSTVAIGFVFAVVLVWGAWAMRSAYVGWVERQLSQSQFASVVVRFTSIYLVLSFFLLS